MALLKRNKVFQLLDAVPTNPRWSWSAISRDHQRAVFTLWEDETIGGKNRLLWDDYDTRARHGQKDQQRILDLVMSKNIPAYGVVCVAKDPAAKPRIISETKTEYLVRLAIYKDSSGVVHGRHVGRVLLVDLVKALSRSNQIDDGLMDLPSPPPGCDSPDRALSAGWVVVRDEKVRAYVIGQAK